MIIRLYCLIDPRTNMPFYVGATSKPLAARLRGHCAPSQQSTYTRDRFELMKELGAMGIKPQIKLLMLVSHDLASIGESFCYNFLKENGFQLLQAQGRFGYLFLDFKNILK